MALFGRKDAVAEDNEKPAAQTAEKIIEYIPPNALAEFAGHPFAVREDEEMMSLVESIKELGIVVPLLVRKLPSGVFEIISGHRRKHAAVLLGLRYVPCEVLDISHDEAIPMMVAANLETRKNILPSEKAFAYLMRLNALNKQGKRTDLTSDPLGPKLRSNQILASETNDSTTQIKRYIRLTYLCRGLLNLVDSGALKMRPAIEISYLSIESQAMLLRVIEMLDHLPTTVESIKLRQAEERHEITFEFIKELFEEKAPNDCPIILRLSKEQLEKLNGDVARTKFSREEYLRRMIDSYELKAVPENFDELIHEYKKIGGNLNQLLQIYHFKGLLNVPEVEELIGDLRRLNLATYSRFS